mmetsp:Transcript_12329/g.31581  ORF Transcript_12329/g.31581 Transcript_12329/m.31581 type:complete len:250 (-) Transcript_12329:444-1193(-)
MHRLRGAARRLLHRPHVRGGHGLLDRGPHAVHARQRRHLDRPPRPHAAQLRQGPAPPAALLHAGARVRRCDGGHHPRARRHGARGARRQLGRALARRLPRHAHRGGGVQHALQRAKVLRGARGALRGQDGNAVAVLHGHRDLHLPAGLRGGLRAVWRRHAGRHPELLRYQRRTGHPGAAVAGVPHRAHLPRNLQLHTRQHPLPHLQDGAGRRRRRGELREPDVAQGGRRLRICARAAADRSRRQRAGGA